MKMGLGVTMRPHRTQVRLLIAISVMLLASCEEPTPSAVPTNPSPLDGIDGGVCAEPEEGCPCADGVEPAVCYVSPLHMGESVICQQGTLTCAGGVWSACNPVREYAIRAPKALGTPAACNPCNPACTTQTTTPNGTDLVPTNSSNVTYNVGLPGIVVNTVPPSGSATLPDSDGDGFPNAVDDCVGPGVRAPCDGDPYSVEEDGFVFTLPPGTAATGTYPDIELQLKSADVYVLQDASGSMNEEIANIRTNLSSGTIGIGSTCAAGMGGGLIGAIRCAIPNSEFGSGMTREYPRSSNDDYQTPFTPLLDITTSLSTAQRVINAYTTQPNNQGWPEATGQALYAIGSGRGLSRWLPDRGTCPNGGRGYPCFRTDAIPIVLVITDAPFNNGPTGNAYASVYNGIAGANLPRSITLDATGRSALVAETAATAFDLGDMTNRSVTVAGTTTGMANDYTLPAACSPYRAAGNGPDAVFRFTLTATRTFNFRTDGSDYDGMLAIRSSGFSSSNAAANIVACDDDSGGLNDGGGSEVYDYASSVTTSLAAGTYYIHMDGYGNGNAGAFQMRMFNQTSPTTGMSTTPTASVSWAQTVAALNSIGAKTIGVASCSCSQSWLAYESCRVNNNPQQAFCLAAYNQCISLNAFGANTATRCTAQRNACANSVAAEQSAPSSCSGTPSTGVRTRACTAARTYCVANGGSNANCNTMQTTCNGATDPCSTQTGNSCACTDNDCRDTLYDLRTLGTATGSVDTSGRPFVYGVATNGSGLSGTIVDAIVDLSEYLSLDVNVACIDNPGTAINECTAFNVVVAPTPNCPATCAGGRSGNTCLDCAPGSEFDFIVNVNNTGVAQTMTVQVFEFDLVALADGTTELLRVPVRIVVPPLVMSVPQVGSFTQVYSATDRCVIPPQRPRWGNLDHDITVPAGTSLAFAIRTSDSLMGLATATAVTVTATSGMPIADPLNVGTLLANAGVGDRRPYLSVTAVLTTNAAATTSPVLRGFTFNYTCEDIE